MPKFSYVAMDSRGKETKGTLEVANQNEAIGRIKEMGFFPTKVVEADKTKEKPDGRAKAGRPAGKKSGGGLSNLRIPGFGGKVKTKELIRLELMLSKGEPINLWAEVVEEANEIGFALQFTSVEEAEMSRLERFIAECLSAES